MKIIVDIGSTHMGKYEYLMELLEVAESAGVDALKFQFFKDKPPNIEFPSQLVGPLMDKAKIEVFASVWDKQDMDFLKDHGCKSIKFAYSMRNELKLIERALKLFETVYVSGDVMTDFLPGVTRLYCIPEYPVIYHPSFNCLFDGRFHGYSDHTLGIVDTLSAFSSGAKIIEKHITLDHDDCLNVPDGKFALKPKELKAMVEAIK
jgi:N-acetylneuraminate synthase/N,N'-diacetyllegionaminate synthase